MAIQSFPGKSQSTYQTSAPSNPRVGDIWLDSDSTSSSLNSNDYLLKNDGVKLFPSSTNNTITAFDASAVPLTLKGYLGQSVNLLNIITSASQNLLSLDNNANLTIGHSLSTSSIRQNGTGTWMGYTAKNYQSTASNATGYYFSQENENSIHDATINFYHQVDGSSSINILTTPAGSKTSDRRQASVIVEGAGYLRLPYQPSFSVYSYSLPSLNGIIDFNVEQFNIGGHFSLVNNRFTAPVAGRYLFAFYAFREINSTGNITLYFSKNGGNIPSRIYDDEGGTSYGPGYALIQVISLAANDYVQINVTGGTLHGNENCFFSGHLLG